MQDIDAAVDVGRVHDPEHRQVEAAMELLEVEGESDEKAHFASTLPRPLYNPDKAESITGDEDVDDKRLVYLIQNYESCGRR